MRGILLPTALGLAFLGSATVALAQGYGHHGRSGGGGVRSPGGSAMHAPAGRAMRAGPSGGARVEFHARRAYQAPRAIQQRSHRVERSLQRSVRSPHAEPRRFDRHQQSREQRELGRNRQVERNAERERLGTGQRAVEGRQGREAREHGSLQRVAERHNEIQQARTRLGMADRERLYRAFNVDRARLTRVNFDHRVGNRIPRHVRLFAVPAAVFALFPYYRDYSYFDVDDEICIVDPRTYVVVDVIEPDYWSGPGRPQVAGLRLSEREIALVRDSIPPDFPDAGIRLRLALGAEIADDVRLHEFPKIVLDRVPQLRQYRFLVSADQIVIVHPHDRAIALVIDRR
jgi:Protein of unknown function (DUF1236)